MHNTTMPRFDDLVTINTNRERIYAFLSKVYEVELTRELIDKMRSGDVPPLDPKSLDGLTDSDVQEGFALLSRGIAAMKGKKLDDVWTDLASDFAGTFLGVKYDILPHPSESAYSSGDHLVYQKSRNDVLSYYREAGLDKISTFTEPEDHVAIELIFMSLLARQTADALNSENIEESKRLIELQKRFLKEHLTKWVPRLCDDILKAARLDFYKGVARMTKGFVSADVSLLDEMTERIGKA